MGDVTFPTSYADPVYAQLDAQTEQKLGLPQGLISSIRTNGEKSNADQVSEAGARTPYQITPGTRKLALDKWGIDPYLSPQNASEVAGRLLQDSLQRRQGDQAMAVAEYHGGTDPANWGPRTQAYVARVFQGEGFTPHGQKSAIQTLMDRMNGAQPAVANIYNAYQSGQMSPEQEQAFESDVNAGRVMLPQGAQLKGAAVPIDAGSAAANIFQAYQAGQMSPEQRTAYERDVRNGVMPLPQGVDPKVIPPEPSPPQKAVNAVTSLPGRVAEAVTGHERSTPETQSLPEWTGMPELSQMSLASVKAGIGSITGGGDSIAKVMKANFPDMPMRQDAKGNWIFTSPTDGKDYVVPPGISLGDLPRALFQMLAFTPASRATTIAGSALANAGTQAAIEGTKAATGGDFSAGNVATAGMLGAAVPAASRVLGALRGNPAAAAIEGAEAGPAGNASIPQAASTTAPTVEQVSQTAGRAAAGKGSAVQELAAMAAPDAEIQASAERLGVGDALQSDHVTTSDAYRQTLGVLKSNPTSQLALAEKEGLAKVAERASSLIDEIGGTTDLSQLDESLKGNMQATHAMLGRSEDALWKKLREAIPATTPAPAENTLAFVEKRLGELGGDAKNLTPFEREILAKASPGPDPLQGLSDAARQQAAGQGAQGAKQPTYALLDTLRQQAGRMSRMNSAFTDADTGLAKKLYSLLTEDQEAVANQLGKSDVVQAAKAATTTRKAMEDDLSALFGKRLDASMVPQLRSAMQSAAKGDTSGLFALLKATPEDMREPMVASGLSSVFRNQATRGKLNFTGFAKWYENLQRNQQAFTAVMTHLPEGAPQQLNDLYLVSKGISESLAARIKTGLRSTVLQEMQAPDSLASRLFDVAKKVGKGIALEGATSAVGAHGAGLGSALTSALMGSAKPSALKAIDELLVSPEFAQLAKQGATPAPATVRTFAFSPAFSRFFRAVGRPAEMSNREQWVLRALQTTNNLTRGQP